MSTNRKLNIGYQMVTRLSDDVTWPPKVLLWGSTVGYPSDNLASCHFSRGSFARQLTLNIHLIPQNAAWTSFIIRHYFVHGTRWSKAHLKLAEVHQHWIWYLVQVGCWLCDTLVMYRARRSEARIQQMLWKINYSDIVFVNTVCL